MLNAKDIARLYQKYDVKASKRFGQNFLIEPTIMQKIIDGAKCFNQEVIEIGPGLGSLSLSLLKEVKSLTAYEIDQQMIKVLTNEIKDSKFKLKNEDFLIANFDKNTPSIIVANIPYNITSLILFKIFHNLNIFRSATLMVQKEVAMRLLATPSTKSYGKLSVTTQLLAKVSKIVEVLPEAFIPQPKVTSMVIRLDFIKTSYNQKLFDFIKQCFSKQRKTLINNLKDSFDVNKIKEILLKHNIALNVRPQQLKPDDFVKIYQGI